ncbi:hypothetical protein Q7P36_001351 [Cladosporium allicinum]
MPFRPEHSLLRVEIPTLHTIDTRSVENLFGMWSLFSKTSHAMEDGKRLENLSWRLWNRETFCCAQPDRLSPPANSFKPHAATTDIPLPDLSSSLESAVSDELDLMPQARPELTRHLSTESRTRGGEKHITPVDLEKIVISIKESQHLERVEFVMPASSFKPEPVVAPVTSVSQDFSKISFDEPATNTASTESIAPDSVAPTPIPTAAVPISSTSTLNTHNSHMSHDRSGSQESSSTEMSTHSIVRGFKPGGATSSYRSQTNLAAQPTPILKTSPKYQPSHPKKKPAMFTIGTSSGEDESSLDSHMYKSSLSESLKNREAKKQTSFKDEVAIGRAASRHSPVFESDDEDEEISESAIDDDDDSSDWEDSDDNNSGPSSVNDRDTPLFQRVDSQANLTSRRSMLTTLMHEPDRAKAMANEASRSTPALRRSRTTTPNGPSVAGSPVPSMHLQAPIQESSRSKPIIMTTSNTMPNQQLALSPRTTRRNMLSTELTESLRKNLLWERQHRSTGNLTALKRRHTSTDVKNLKQQPEPAPVFSSTHGAKKFNNDFFNAGLQEYHAKGW